MFFAGVGLAIIIAFILTLIVGKGIRKYAYTDLLGFFFVIFLATWAGGLWIEPAGAGTWGATLAVFVVVGTIVALIMAASLPTSAHRTRHAAPTGGPIDKIHQESFQNVFLLVTILALIAAIVFRFIHAWRQ